MSGGKDIVAELDRILRLQEVLEEEDFAAFIIRSTMDGIYTYDLDCRITLWNPAMERLTGVQKGDVIGQSVFERFPFLVEYNLQHQILDPLKGKVCAPSVVPFDIPDTGKRGFVQRYSCPLRDEHNNIVGGLSIVREVTEHRLAVEEVERLNRAEE
ncbi:MAG TPA: PAS domain S-box protein, partial [Bdellovibrionota bacterium]|nr:PAS domain S-box protein [Bdellovibrionota bacterium]